MKIKEFLSKLTIQDWVFTIFSILWVSIIMLDYMNKQVIYAPSFQHFKYFNLFIFLTIVGSLISLLYCRIGPFKKLRLPPLNGLIIFILFLVIVMSVTISYNKYWNAPLDFSNYLHLAGMGIYTIGCTLFLLIGVFSAGNRIRTYFLPEIQPNFTAHLIDIAIGFVIYTTTLLLLGAMGFLNQIVVLLVIAILIGVNFRSALRFGLSVLWKPIPIPKDLKFWGAMIAFFTLVFVTLNYFYTQAPFPLGFDARNYYVNIPKLISEAGGLIDGFQPYAWGLVMSTGYIAFNSPEITLFLSAFGGILSLFAIYHFGNYYLKISSNLSWLVVLLFLLTPTVTNHFMIEFKIDLALLFFEVVILITLMWWLYERRDPEQDDRLLVNRSDIYSAALIGVFMGFALSIKVLSAFLIVGVFLAIWSYTKDIIGVISLGAMFIGVVLIAGLDNLSGLRSYHANPSLTGAILFVIGLIGLSYAYWKKPGASFDALKTLFLCGIFSLLTFSPWIYKNYSYTKSLSITNLLMGQKPKPSLKIKDIRNSETSPTQEN